MDKSKHAEPSLRVRHRHDLRRLLTAYFDPAVPVPMRYRCTMIARIVAAAPRVHATDRSVPVMSDLHDAARDYALQQIPIFPVHSPQSSGQCSCGHAACANVGKHPASAHGLHDATTDLTRIDLYWSRHPGANIGIPTGQASRRFVVDIDPSAGGYDSADDLQSRYGAFPATCAVQTGSGGLHLHYAWPPAGVIRNSAGALGPGIDIRGQGGYVVAPPSLHRSGTRYLWTGLDDATEVAAAPAWLLMVLVERPSVPRPASIHPRTTNPSRKDSATPR